MGRVFKQRNFLGVGRTVCVLFVFKYIEERGKTDPCLSGRDFLCKGNNAQWFVLPG